MNIIFILRLHVSCFWHFLCRKSILLYNFPCFCPYWFINQGFVATWGCTVAKRTICMHHKWAVGFRNSASSCCGATVLCVQAVGHECNKSSLTQWDMLLRWLMKTEGGSWDHEASTEPSFSEDTASALCGHLSYSCTIFVPHELMVCSC